MVLLSSQRIQLHNPRANRPTCLPPIASASTSTQQLICTFSPAAGHDKPEHPETAARITALRQAVLQQQQLQLLQPQPSLTAADIKQLSEVLQLVHPAGYLARLQEICSSLTVPTMIDDSTYIAPGSFTACCETAAAVLDVLDCVLKAPTPDNSSHAMGFALVRPPGHHVKATRPMGFGLINFIAVAARYALQQPGINKVLILDWDVHHGNGTEDIFYNTDDVLYISTHQQGLWPYTGKATATGSGPGQGYTINVPLPGDSGHEAMLAVWQRVVEPAARRFQPDIILCSAGYDAHWADPLAGLQFEARTYAMLCQRTAALASELCCGRCIWVLEGGYDLPSLSDSVNSSISAIMQVDGGDEGLAMAAAAGAAHLRPEPIGKVDQVLQQVVQLHGL